MSYQPNRDDSHAQRPFRVNDPKIVSDGREGNEMAYDMTSLAGISHIDSNEDMKVVRVFSSVGELIDDVRFEKSISINYLLDRVSKKSNYSSSLFCTKRGSIVVIRGELNASTDIQCKLCDLCALCRFRLLFNAYDSDHYRRQSK